jgi:hypothetical protein
MLNEKPAISQVSPLQNDRHLEALAILEAGGQGSGVSNFSFGGGGTFVFGGTSAAKTEI